MASTNQKKISIKLKTQNHTSQYFTLTFVIGGGIIRVKEHFWNCSIFVKIIISDKQLSKKQISEKNPLQTYQKYCC